MRAHTKWRSLPITPIFIYFSKSLKLLGESKWNKAIPPSRTSIVWKLLHNRIPTDDLRRKCEIFNVTFGPNWYNSCETTEHFFFSMSFAVNLWNWLESINE